MLFGVISFSGLFAARILLKANARGLDFPVPVKSFAYRR